MERLNGSSLEFKWTVSRGRDTYGYNICSLYVNGQRVSACNGGGYDMKGTSLGNWIERAYADRLRALKPEDMPEQSHWEADYKAWICRECLPDRIAAELEPVQAHAEEIPNCPNCNALMDRDNQAGERVSDGRKFYGLTFHDPNYDPGKAVIGKDCADRTLGGNSEGQTVAEREAAGVSIGLERYQAIYAASSPHATERHTVPSIDGGCGMSSVERILEAIGLKLEWVPGRQNRKNDIYILRDSGMPRACDCKVCAVCKAQTICAKCNMCARCHSHAAGCAGCNAHPSE